MVIEQYRQDISNTTERASAQESPAPGSIAAAIAPLVHTLLGPNIPVRIEFWDKSALGPAAPAAGNGHSESQGRIVMHRADALRRLLYAPGELGFARAYVSGDADIVGDSYRAVRLLRQASPDDLRLSLPTLKETLRAVVKLGLVGKPLPNPPEEAHVHGRLHSKSRDEAAVTHHYNVSNEFYRLILGETMTYSCARFAEPDYTLEQAQRAKYELIANKLALSPGQSLLDVGCGWGGMVLHAAQRHGVKALGVTLSSAQHEWAQRSIRELGLQDRVSVEVRDYRDVRGHFDGISSIGMFEHVGIAQMAEYFTVLYNLLPPTGRLLNHAISKPGGARFSKRSFVGRYVFPDAELQDVSVVIGAMQRAGFEVRDVESLREHYALTLRAWVRNLEENWDQAVALAGVRRARVWRLYMTGSAVSFEDGDISVHQVLGVRTDASGNSGMPRTRRSFETRTPEGPPEQVP